VRRNTDAPALAATGLLGFVFMAPAVARAAEYPSEDDHVQPCRPTVSCTAELVAPGKLEVEAGTNFAHASDGDVWAMPFLIKLGLWRRLEIEVGSEGYTAVAGRAGTQDMYPVFVEPKLLLIEERGALPYVSVSAQVGVPTSSVIGYGRYWDLGATAYVTKEVGPLNVDLNVGLDSWRGGDQGSLTQLSYSGALAQPLPADFAVQAGAYYESDAGPIDPRDGGAQGAITFAPRPWLQFDAGGDWGFFPTTRKYSLFAGMTIIPAVL
jgi:hypothetical protein